MIYPNSAYYDVVDSVYYISAQDNFSLVNTNIFSRDNEKIRAETRNKFEASIDQRFGRFGISLTGFYEETHDGFELSGYNPASLTKYSRPYWPNENPAFPKDTILTNYRTAINSLESISRGLELTLQSTRIPLINTTFRVNAAYHFSDPANFFESNHGSYLNQRVNLVTYLGRNTQARLGYGRSSSRRINGPVWMILWLSDMYKKMGIS
jgi:hypothetical protein